MFAYAFYGKAEDFNTRIMQYLELCQGKIFNIKLNFCIVLRNIYILFCISVLFLNEQMQLYNFTYFCNSFSINR